MQVPTQPALLGISAWPGWLTLTNFDLYFESLGVGVNEKAVRYDLATDLKQLPTSSPVSLLAFSQLGFILQKDANLDVEALIVGDFCVGEANP
ncbi:hypothetical protein REPUB_Repub01dG0151000 [Reevesia pubescens]